ncbi:MAG TPA: DUF4402 domain-containing protein [Sphingomicrobium sp.]|jgi:hypothetical protein|nr:DUF4402 domain-containing protein [Sphingomicrobium sp.]
MTSYARHLILYLGGCSAALCAPAYAVTQSASVNAQVVRPLTLTSVQNLDLGTIVLGAGTWSGATLGISKGGVFTCSPNVTCTGTPRVAQFNVTGTNKMVVLISAPNVTLVNQNNSSQTLSLAIDSPGQVTLTNDGQPGINFNIGGSVALSSSTAGGTYRGTIDVTVNYQ